MNSKDINIIELLLNLLRQIDRKRKKQLILLTFLMLISALMEVISLGAVIPFLAILIEPEIIFDNSITKQITSWLEINTSNELVLPITLIFITSAIFTGALRVLLLWANSHIAYTIGSELSAKVYSKLLAQPYINHINNNTSKYIDVITHKVNVTVNVIYQTLTLISSIFLLLAITTALLYINYIIAIISFSIFGISYFIISKNINEKLKNNSIIISKEQSKSIKTLQEGFGGIREVILNGLQEYYTNIFKVSDYYLRKTQGNNAYIGSSPRYIMESVGMVLIASIAYILNYQKGGISEGIPMLGALALGAQRLLPAMQLIFYAWTTIKGSEASVKDTLNILQKSQIERFNNTNLTKLNFNKYIHLKDVEYKYEAKNQNTIKNVDIKILKGTRIGVIGKSGAGKSTIIDLIMGLLKPNNGYLLIDDEIIDQKNIKSWQLCIAHVPQYIYLADATIAENIAFGIQKENIDKVKLLQAAEQSQILEYIESTEAGFETMVGERGIRLSGGQRQRIGIARALYKQADVLIFDEATSSLDNETESEVMRSINSLSKDLTLIIIAHRLTTLIDCDNIIEIDDGQIRKISNCY